MKRIFLMMAILIAVGITGVSCSKDSGEGPEGPEGTGGEAGNESGTLWSRSETADETVNGIRLILSFDEAQQAFVGTLENINTTVSPQVRVEVHVFDANQNSTEYGPTTPADMQAGEIRNVILPTPGAGNFVNFNMHPEVGGSEGGEGGSEGSEGSGS